MAQQRLFYRSLSFGCLAKHVALQVVSATGVYLKKYTKKRNRLENFKFNL